MATQPHVPLYSTHDGELVVTDPDSGQVLWQGLIQAMPISKIAPVPGAADAIVLLDYDKQPPGGFPEYGWNIVRVSPEGRLVWQARTPKEHGHDFWWDFKLQGRQLTAWSFSSFEVVINLETGARARRRWTH
jgi:hypothetical protein